MPDSTLTASQQLQSAAMRAFGRIPRPVLDRLAARLGGPPVNLSGERLAADIWLGLRMRERLGRGGRDTTEAVSIAQARRGLDADALIFSERPDRRVVEYELSFQGPDGPLTSTRYRPPASGGVMVYFHGGGWVLGSRASHAGLCRLLAVHGEIDVISVDYRLAPEHRFPAAVEDAAAAWAWATGELMPGARRRVIAGDSAGGNLAAVVAQQTRGDEDLSPTLQLLFYPAVDLSSERDSVREFATGFQLTHDEILWFKRQYARSESDYRDPRASPILTADLSALPAAYISVAGFDPLRDEGVAYAERLRAAGVAVTLYRASSLIHGFANLTAVSPDARAAVLDACEAIKRGG